MKKFLMLAMVISFIMTMTTSALAGILSTRHNLSNSRTGAMTVSNNNGTVIYSLNQDQLCVWCHTPHAAFNTDGPLWNKSTTNAAFTTYPTTVGGSARATSIGTKSKICLTCHDGTLAINIVINAPGSGGVVATGAQFGLWQGLNTATNALMGGVPTNVANVSTDLSNDHPISIVYSTPTTNTADNPGSLRTTGYVLAGTTTWVPRQGTVSGAKIEGLLDGNDIQCVSCHDPHTDANATFLRATTTGSRICITCHDK